MFLAATLPASVSCDQMSDFSSSKPALDQAIISDCAITATPEGICTLLSSLPLGQNQLEEVHAAVTRSIANGYDEEYTFRNIVLNPGSGTGDDFLGTRSDMEYVASLKDMLFETLDVQSMTRSVDLMSGLAESGLQIYWPYSEDWDGKTIPTITFNPEDGSESNTGYLREQLPSGQWIVKEVVVDEEYAMKNPVWVVNRNSDEGCMTPQVMEKLCPQPVTTRATTSFKTLRLKEFKAHRNYDCFLAGGSEFFIKCGSLKAFTATVVDDLTRYSPEITDLVVNVKRSKVGQTLRYNTILASEWSSQLDECAFLIIEDDGGKRTTWKCNGTVKIKSKSYGFEVEFPLNINDDIVWRGKLSQNYLAKYTGQANRLGDVSVTFTFE